MGTMPVDDEPPIDRFKHREVIYLVLHAIASARLDIASDRRDFFDKRPERSALERARALRSSLMCPTTPDQSRPGCSCRYKRIVGYQSVSVRSNNHGKC